MKKFFLLAALAAALAAPAALWAAPKAGDPVYVLLKTNFGDIKLELDPAKAPVTVANFVQYVKDGHYDGAIFHRVIPDFMIQGGGFDAKMNERKTRPPITNEADNGLKNAAYTVAMARTNDPQSATAQFFINVKNNDFLNFKSKSGSGWGYAVFGKVVAGQDVVDKIKMVPTVNRGHYDDVPTSPVIIEKASALDK